MEPIEQLVFQSKDPYPDICVAEQNPLYARAMLDNLGGQNSEMSAISLYLYNNLITCPHEEIPVIFHKISVVEMHHLEIFGKLSLQLGENPRLWTNKGNRKRYWSPSYNNYPMDLKPLLINAINGENAAIEKYSIQARQILDRNIVENLNRIIEDERYHVELFKSMYQEYCN